jgi:hypothetical protein
MGDCGMAKKNRDEMVSGCICLANGRSSFVRSRGFPLVSPVAAAISNVVLDAADHSLDREHFCDICPVALARDRAFMGSTSWLGNVAGIWIPGNCGCDSLLASIPSSTGPAMLNRVK